MRCLLTVSLLAGLVVGHAAAQRAVSAGRGGGYSAPHSFAPAPHISGGFGAGSYSAPRPMNSAPQYHWNAPGNISGHTGSAPQSRMQYGSPHTFPAPDSRHGRRPVYPGSRYRQPYVPYVYASSTYLVPGTLNSYSDYQDGFNVNDEPASAASGQDNGSYQGSYQQEPGPGDSYQEPNQGAYQAQDVPPPPPGPSEPLPQAALTLVFKDGHSQQIRNYAMTQTTLYVLDDAASGRRPEIPLNLIDVSATEKTNRDAGVDFNVPAAR